MRFIDLFAGLGGFHLAAAHLGGKCVFASELDDRLRGVYDSNFGIKPAGDIREVDISSIPEHDLLCAGFPCQPFSKAGSQLGWADAVRGTLFENIVCILRHHEPEYVILENVAHFVNHDKGNTYRKVKEALESLGYDVLSKQLSPHDFGVPQIRKRMYMVGRLGGLGEFRWPEPNQSSSQMSVRDILDHKPKNAKGLSESVLNCLDTWQDYLLRFPEDEKLPSFPIWSMECKATYPYEYDSLYDANLPELRKKKGSFGGTLNTHFRRDILARVPSYAAGGEGTFPYWKKRFIMQNRALYRKNKGWINQWLPRVKPFVPSLQKFEWNCQGEDRDIWKYVIQFRASGVRVKRPTTSPSLVAMTSTQVPIVGWERRYMTVRECARLQSMEGLQVFPNGEAAMKALGNAVNVTVVKHILKNLCG